MNNAEDGGRLGGSSGCRILRDEGAQMDAWADMCLLCRIAPAQLLEAQDDAAATEREVHGGRGGLVRGVEALVKRLAERRGLYWLLHTAAHPNCTIWPHLISLGLGGVPAPKRRRGSI